MQSLYRLHADPTQEHSGWLAGDQDRATVEVGFGLVDDGQLAACLER
jgi:hypothetical protein